MSTPDRNFFSPRRLLALPPLAAIAALPASPVAPHATRMQSIHEKNIGKTRIFFSATGGARATEAMRGAADEALIGRRKGLNAG